MIDSPLIAEAPDVAFQHRAYQHNLAKWVKCRDAVEGEEAVKAKGEAYLPRLSGADDDENRAYRHRAEFFAASYRTVQGLSGAVTRKPPEIEWPASLEDMLDRIGNNGESLQLLTSMTLEEVLTTGRIGLYVDAPEGENPEPYVTTYCPENIINWRTRTGPDGRHQFSLIVLKEEAEVDGPDGFTVEVVEQYRVLRLSDDAEPVYSVEVYHKVEAENNGKKETSYILQSEVTPRMTGGRGFDEIPFVFIGPSGITGHIEKPPILDLVNTNFSHYRTSADLEHGRHWVALPTPCASGVRFEGKPKIGPTGMLHSEDPAARFSMLEFSGAGLLSLERGQEQKERRMAVQGSRLLEAQKTGVEAAETVRLRTSGEHSVLANVATSVSEGLTKAMSWIIEWKAVDGDASIVLPQDFNATTLDSQMMTALLMAYIQGTISYETYIYNLNRGEILPDGTTVESERELVAAGGPLLPPKQLAQDESDGAGKVQAKKGGQDAEDVMN